MKPNELLLVDTTLRDGEQSAGLAFRVKDKIRIAGYLEGIGIDRIEAGIPALGDSEVEAISQIVAHRKHTRISTWNRLRESDIRQSFRCDPDIIHLSAPVSYAQIYVKLRRNKQWLVKQLKVCVDLALEHGYVVTVGFEDASRADIGFLISLCEMLQNAGVDMIRYADTVGVSHPGRMIEDIRTIIRETGIQVEIHTHNDLGMATANAVAAVSAGAVAVDCTINGIGERTGNCGLSAFLTALAGMSKTNTDRQQAMMLELQLMKILENES